MAKQPDLNRLIRVTWGVSPFPNVIFFSGGSDVCNCDITASNDVEFTNKTMDYNLNTFLNFPHGAISTLTDVTISSVTNNQVLSWDTATSKWKNRTISSGSSTFTGLTDVSITAFSPSDPNDLQDGVPVVWNKTAQKWDRGGYDAHRILLADTKTLFTNGGTPIFCKFGFANVTGSTGDIVSYNMPNARFTGNRSISVAGCDDGDSGSLVLGNNAINTGSHTATIGTLTGKPGTTNVTDAAGWLQLKINGAYYVVPIFAL